MGTTTVIGASIIGLVLLVFGGILYWKKKSLKVVSWAWWFGVLCVTGSAMDAVRKLLQQASTSASPAFGLTTNVALGLAGVALWYVVWLEAPLKKGKGRAATPAGHGPGSSGGRTAAGYTPFVAVASALCLGALTGGTLAVWRDTLIAVVGRFGSPLSTFFGA